MSRTRLGLFCISLVVIGGCASTPSPTFNETKVTTQAYVNALEKDAAEKEAIAKTDKSDAAQASAITARGAVEGAKNEQNKLYDPGPFGQFGFSFGVGVSFLNHADIKATRLESGVVRITDSEKQQRAAWLVTQYLFDKKAYAYGRRITHGPFFALQAAGTDGPFNAAAAGYMISLKRKAFLDPDRSALNFGLGMFSTKIQRLSDGIAENEPLPSGVQEVTLRKKDANGLMLLVSFSIL